MNIFLNYLDLIQVTIRWVLIYMYTGGGTHAKLTSLLISEPLILKIAENECFFSDLAHPKIMGFPFQYGRKGVKDKTTTTVMPIMKAFNDEELDTM